MHALQTIFNLNIFISKLKKHFLRISRFIYETEHHNGIAELLEILGRFVIFVFI